MKLSQTQIFEYKTSDSEKAEIQRFLAGGGWVEADPDGGYYAVHQDRDGGRSEWGSSPAEAVHWLMERLGGINALSKH